MSETELLSLGAASYEAIAGLFGQIITITFAMVVAIYYFLNRSPLLLKIFAFLAYMIGMLMYFGLMLIQSNVRAGIVPALKALPLEKLSLPARHYIAVSESFVATTTSAFMNIAFHVLWIGVFYLTFFWKKAAGPTA